MSLKTTVSLGDMKFDLLKLPLTRACVAINAWHRSRAIFTDDFRKTFVESDPGWAHARALLIRNGKVELDYEGNIVPKKGKKNDTNRIESANAKEARR